MCLTPAIHSTWRSRQARQHVALPRFYAQKEAPMLTITESAKRKILSVIQAQGQPGDGLRIAIVGRSSSGFQYDLHLVEEGEAEAEDIIIDTGDFPVIIDPESAPHLKDVIID